MAGKKTNEWNRERKKLKLEYESRGITSCEIRGSNCTVSSFLSFAHRYKRNDPNCTHDFNGTILACINCHNLIEYDSKLTEETFERLR